MSGKRIVILAVSAVMLIMCAIIPFACTATVDADEIVVHQSVGGELTVWTEPGWHWQGMGDITRYKRSDQVDFLVTKPTKDKDGNVIAAGDDQCISVRFNDNGEAHICGSTTYDLPLDHEAMLKLHKTFGSMEAIEQRLVEKTLIRSVYMSGPLMSSKESAGERRNELIHFVIDQADRGVYQTETVDKEVDDLLAPPIKKVVMRNVPVIDPETNKPALDENGKPIMKHEPVELEEPAKKNVAVVLPKLGEDGKPLVQEESALTAYGIKMYNLTVSDIIYEGKVKEQIEKQRQAIMDIQTKIAQAKAAEQQRVTVEKEGQAAATKAKWDQEVKKSQAITEAEQKKAVAIEQAEQKRAVAEKDLESAKLERQAAVERAQGDAKARKLRMEADGALEKKLAAYVEIQKAWAASIGSQPLVPQVQMGNSGSHEGMNLMSLLTAKMARDLALDPGMRNQK